MAQQHFLASANKRPRTRVVATAAASLVTTGIGGAAWAAITTANDDWDDYYHALPRFFSSANNNEDENKKEKILILGSGWAGLGALRKCAADGPNNNKDIVIVSPRSHFLYTPSLAGSAVRGVGTGGSACITEPIGAFLKAAGATTTTTHVRADARDVDVVKKTVVLAATTAGEEEGGYPSAELLELPYDKLIVAVGSMPNTFGIPGVKEHGLFLREADDAARLRAKLLSNLERAAELIETRRHDGAGQEGGNNKNNNNKEDGDKDEIDRLLKIVVVGGGPSGVKLAAELAGFKASSEAERRFGREATERVRIVLVELLPRILGPLDSEVAKTAHDHLVSRGVEVRTATAATSVGDGTVTLAPSTPRFGTSLSAATSLLPEQPKGTRGAAPPFSFPPAEETTEDVGVLVWTAGIRARPVVEKLARALGQKDMSGLRVDAALRVEGTDGCVYAIGDAALVGYSAPSKHVAEREGKHVGRAIRDGVDAPFVRHRRNKQQQQQQQRVVSSLAPAASFSSASLAPVPLFFSKLLSNRSRMDLLMDWMVDTTRITLLGGRPHQRGVEQPQPSVVLEEGTAAKQKDNGSAPATTTTATSRGGGEAQRAAAPASFPWHYVSKPLTNWIKSRRSNNEDNNDAAIAPPVLQRHDAIVKK